MPSAAEQEWCGLAAAVRRHLAGRAKAMPDMGVGALRAFVDTLREAQAFDLEARAFDLAADEHAERLRRRAAYGG